MLILICGLPGTGKSTLAKALTEKLGSAYLSSDTIRRKMLEERTYSEDEKYRVYRRMVEETERVLSSGKTVVCDATFYKRRTRDEMRAAAKRRGAKVFMIMCVLDEKVLEERIEQRKELGEDESEAGFRIYLKVKSLFEPIKAEYLTVDMMLPLEEQVEKVEKELNAKFGWEPDELVSNGMELKETHISWVFLEDDYVYKVKKPVKFSFLDFSTPDKRKEYCEEEVRLNRRLCPDIYLEVVPLVRSDKLGFEGEGKVLDYAVKMKRMKGGETMDKMLETNVSEKEIREIAEQVAAFHQSVPSIQDPAYNSPETVMEQIDDLNSVKSVVEESLGIGDKIDFVLEKSREFVEKNEKLLRTRQAEGMVKECHGDLHSGNVYLGEKAYIFDCIEFNEDFRLIDVASEIAFMAMDLDASGREELSEAFVREYVELSGDSGLEKLLTFYKCYRANVRAKVAALGYSQNPTDEGKKNMEKYLVLAEGYASEF